MFRISKFLSHLAAQTLATFAFASCAISVLGQPSVTTYHNDIARTGLNSSETILNPSNVRPSTFGLLFNLPVDGQVYAQPLYLPNVSVPGKGTHNIVYIATEHNSIYAYDADTNAGANSQALWKVNFGPSVPNGDTGTGDIVPEVGITSTPVIGSITYNNSVPLLYVISKTKTLNKTGQAIYTQKLHALDTTTGAEKLGGPVVIQGSVFGTGEGSVGGIVTFNSLIQHSRAALLIVPQTANSANPQARVTIVHGGAPALYVAFASHGDNGPYHGWVFVYDTATLSLLGIVNTTPNGLTDPSGYPIAAGGIWQGGAGPASDGKNIYFATGNGKFDPATGSYGDAIVRMTDRVYKIADYFAPANQLNLDDYDADLGSGGVMLLPSSVGSKATPNLLVHAGKEGTIYLVNRSNLGKYGTTDKIVQELPYVMGGIWGMPAYFNGNVYFGPSYSGIVSFPISNGAFTKTQPSSYTGTYYQYPGPTPSVSSNGTANGIVWAIQADGYGSNLPAILHAYDATDLSKELFNSGDTGGRDLLGGATKFNVPTIVNGKVFVGTTDSVGVFGLGSWVAAPVITPNTGIYASSVTVKITDATVGAAIYYTLDGSIPTTSSKLYTAPFKLAVSASIRARGFKLGFGASSAPQMDYLIGAVTGTGTGLRGNYFNGSQDPAGTPTATRIDPTVNFDWGGGSPIGGVDGNNWAGEWKGQIQAYTTGTYTLYTNTDDGVRVYIDGNLIIDNYTYHAPTIDRAQIALVAGAKHTIDIKFFQGSGGSVMQLYWSAPGLPMQIVPTTQLYPAAS